jgi:hypothetical protein
MFITGNFDRLAVEAKQRDDPTHVIRRQAGINIDGKRIFLWKTDHTPTGIIVVGMCLETMLDWCGWFKVIMEIIVSAIANGVAIGFAIGKRYCVNQDVGAYFEENTDF